MFLVIEKASDHVLPKTRVLTIEEMALAMFNHSLHSDKCQWILWAEVKEERNITVRDYRGPP